MKNYYIVRFEPEEYGVISYKVYTRKVAYEYYHKLKETTGQRPGKLYVMEYIWQPETQTYKEQYLCLIRTGKENNGKLIIEHMLKELKHLQNDIYNQSLLEKRIDQLSDLELNIIHGCELLDSTKVPDRINDIIVDNIQIVSAARRGNKHLLADCKSVGPKLRELYNILRSINDKLDSNKVYRQSDKNTGKKAVNDKEARNKYFTALGINIEAYESDDLENMINKDAIVSLLKKINE
jgi:hypothetical protein